MFEPRNDVKIIRAANGTDTENKIRVGAYCRVSTDSEEQVDSFIAQVKYYTDFISHSSDMVLVDIYADEGITGTCANKRDEFQRMLKDSKAGKLDRIYVKSVSRFARNSLECIENIRLLKSNGTSVLFENDNIDTDKMNSEMILYIKSAFAQSEALAGSRRVSTAIRMRMERGEFITTKIPFGYRMENNILVPYPIEAEVVKNIYLMFLSGIGIGSIVKKLNDDSVCNIFWQQSHVKYILQNEKYIGDSLYQKTYTPFQLPLKKKRNHGEVDKYYVTNSHEGIIEKSVFYQVQDMFHYNFEKYKNKCAPKAELFTGILYCSDCRRAYKLRQINSLKPTWVCSENGVAGRRCNTHPVTEIRVKKTFTAMLNKLQQQKDILINQTITQLENIKRQYTAENETITEIDKEITALCDKNEFYIHLKFKGIIDDVSFNEQSNAVQKRIFELRSRRKKLLCSDDDEQVIEGLRELKEILDDYPVVTLDFNETVFRRIIKRIAVKPESLIFEFNCGIKLEEPLWK